ARRTRRRRRGLDPLPRRLQPLLVLQQGGHRPHRLELVEHQDSFFRGSTRSTLPPKTSTALRTSGSFMIASVGSAPGDASGAGPSGRGSGDAAAGAATGVADAGGATGATGIVRAPAAVGVGAGAAGPSMSWTGRPPLPGGEGEGAVSVFLRGLRPGRRCPRRLPSLPGPSRPRVFPSSPAGPPAHPAGPA